MKWSELSLKERKQIYDSVRANNPNASYFDIKTQFDSIPAYEDGGKVKTNKPDEFMVMMGLVPGTSQYTARQQQISGRAEVVQPEAYLSPAGYIKDAITTIEDLAKGDYGSAAVSALMNVIPFGVGKLTKKLKAKVTSAADASAKETNLYSRKWKGPDTPPTNYMSEFTPTITKKGKKLERTQADHDAELAQAINRNKNVSAYNSEISKTIEDTVFPDEQTMQIMNFVENNFGVNYKPAYKDIVLRDFTNRGKYVKFNNIEREGTYGMATRKGIPGDTYSINDFYITLDPDYHMPGTASHELSHLADGLVDPEAVSNKYIDYLADYDNMKSIDALSKTGRTDLIGTRNYMNNPKEVKAHMIGLKRAMVNEGFLDNWSSKVDERVLSNYLNQFGPAVDKINRHNKNLPELYQNKQGFLNRMNMLTPMQYAAPIGVSGLTGTMYYNNSNRKE